MLSVCKIVKLTTEGFGGITSPSDMITAYSGDSQGIEGEARREEGELRN